MKVDKIYEYLIDYEFFTEEELDLITAINGYNEDTLNDCIYVRFGYRTIEDLFEAYKDDYGFEDYIKD